MSAGYSGRPLAAKLGIESGSRLAVLDPPPDYWQLVDPLPDGVAVQEPGADGLDILHAFFTSRAELARRLPELRGRIRQDGMIWVSWPKKAARARVPSDLTEDDVRGLALENRLVDVKVCAVDETWSGLKLVIRLKDRRG